MFHTEVNQMVSYQIKTESNLRRHTFYCKCAGKPPTLPLLRKFPVKDGFADIAAQIGTDYELFGTFLLDDENGHKVKNIERTERGDSLCITVEILRQWLQGKGRNPVTWQTLIACLRDTHLNVIADNIERTLPRQDVDHSEEL